MSKEHKKSIASKEPDWPIEPTFLSIRAGVERFSIESSPNNDGLFYANELRGILADASAAIWEKDGNDENDIGEGQIFALFQVVPETFKIPKEKNSSQPWFVDFEEQGYNSTGSGIICDILNKNKIIRIHPGNLYPNLDYCEQFRKCEHEGIKCKHKCFKMDSRIALLYHHKLQKILKKEDDKNKWTKFHNKLKKITDDYNKEIKEEYAEGKYKEDVNNIESYLLKPVRYKQERVRGKELENRSYVSYRCIYSGLMEYSFPIIHAGKIIAVLMHGQCAPPLLKNEEMFKKCREHDPELNKRINDKEEKDKNETNEKMRLFGFPAGHKPNEEQLNHVSKLIKTLEERIDNEVKAKSRDYVSGKFFGIERSFRNISRWKANTDINLGDKLEDLRNEIKNLDQKIKKYEWLLNISLRSIISRFNLYTEKDFIRIYALESSIANRVNPIKDTFNLIGDSTYHTSLNNPLPDNRKYKKVVFNKIKERDKTLNKEELLEPRNPEPYFPERYWDKLDGFDSKKDDIRVEFSFSSQVLYLIWERYNNWNTNSEQYKEYNDYLNLLNHTLLEPYIILEGMKLEKDLENSMRISSHESAQIIPDVIETINNIPKTLDALEEETYSGPKEIMIPANKIIDASRRLLLLNNLSRRLSFIFKGKKPDLEKTDFHRIIYAPKSLYQRRARLRNRQQINVSSPDELDLYDLITNYDNLSHILFNLIDNAIKYGLRGSNIQIKALLHYITKETDNNLSLQIKDKVTISVISYGAKIEDVDRENMFGLYYRSTQAKGEGMGIGLFLVKKLCKLLGYGIECIPSVLIADYHLPVKYHYCLQNGKFYDAQHLDEVVNKSVSKWKIRDVQLSKLLPLPTYKNEFKITIPVKEYETLRKKN